MLLFLVLIQLLLSNCTPSDVPVETRNEELIQLVFDMQTKIEKLTDKLATQEDITKMLTQKVAAQDGLFRNQRLLLPGAQSTYEPVAFYAQLRQHDVLLGHLQQVIFEKVVTNVGNAYNFGNGHFTAPIPGVYHFSVSIMALPGKTCSVTIMKNGSKISYLWAHGSNYASQTDNVVLVLEAGDMVWVRSRDGYSGETIHNDHSTFSGFLISSDN